MASGMVTITPPTIQPYTVLLDPNDWTVIVGMREYGQAQHRLVVELDSRHGYFDWTDDGYRPSMWQVGDSDPMTTDYWSPYGSPNPVANRRPFPGVY
jgi:hypothetical protein